MALGWDNKQFGEQVLAGRMASANKMAVNVREHIGTSLAKFN